MSSLYLWPDHPIPSLLVLWLASAVFLWAAREPMLRFMTGLQQGLEQGFRALADGCAAAAHDLRERSRAVLLAAGSLDAQGRLDREFHRVETAFSERLGQYAKLHRKADDLLLKLEADYQCCGDAPPEVPGWSTAIETVSGIAAVGDPNVQKVLEGIRKSSRDAEKRALAAYRGDTAMRHKILARMAPHWKEIRGLLTRMTASVAKALESSQHINAYVEEYEKIRGQEEHAARALTFSAVKLFLVALLVLGIAFGGAFINFHLIALPMSELVPAGARVGGMPVATISALVIVLMEIALGIFIMDMLGITDLFPKLAGVPSSRRRAILVISLGGLFFLATVESSLAVLREQIVGADAALKLALAGAQDTVVGQASASRIPVVGQAVLGFVLPWVLALVAIPLEMLLDAGRHVAALLAVGVLLALGAVARALGAVAGHTMKLIRLAYDVYIGIPLRIERVLTRENGRAGGKRLSPDTKSESEVTA
ncbi:MAG: hypothetical protein O7G30_06810 [Proteobacteria bacterium]|nr:hypothetical protein [Pseudomonadota bacterium]